MKARLALGVIAGVMSTAAMAQSVYNRHPYNEPVDTTKSRPEAQVAPMGPAPALSAIGILDVGSTLAGGFEGDTYGKFITDRSHGGPQIRVLVVKWGYGSNDIARYRGSVLQNRRYRSEGVCGGTPRNPQPCSPGQTIIGFVDYYALDGLGGGGTFQVQSTSTNFPFRTLSTTINLRQ